MTADDHLDRADELLRQVDENLRRLDEQLARSVRSSRWAGRLGWVAVAAWSLAVLVILLADLAR